MQLNTVLILIININSIMYKNIINLKTINNINIKMNINNNSSDISHLLSKLSSQEKKINSLLSLNNILSFKNNELEKFIQSQITLHESQTNNLKNEIKQLNSTIDTLNISNYQKDIQITITTNSLQNKELEYNNLISKYNQLKVDFKLANERNNEYVNKMIEIEANYSKQFQLLNDSFEDLKKKYKLNSKPKLYNK
jgi:hypothetical protein